MNAKKAIQASSKKTSKNAGIKKGDGSFDVDKELEWFRKNQKLMGGKGKSLRTNGGNLPQNKSTSNRNGVNTEAKTADAIEKSPLDLPIFAIQKIHPVKPFAPLPMSNDDSLMSAIEQTHEEFEDDEEIRELSVKILTAFKTRNSVEALSEVALYDLSSNLRSKAVTILSEFDHESVFETILLACADPTREVKAAAARALFRLSFDRANAWTRIAQSDEEGRIRQIARAAIEADLVDRSLDRLVHEDHSIAQEAAAFTALMIKSGETEQIFKALVNHKKMNLRKAILHVIKITKDQKALEGLYSLLEQKNLPLELQEEVDKTIEEMGFVTV
jgi:HEAT repeat protein